MNRFSLRAACAFGTLAALAFLSGCASFNRIAEYPTPAKPVTVGVVVKNLSTTSDLPVGAYYDPQRQIVISGHQKGLGWGMAFGLVGVLVADSANRSSATDRFGAAEKSSTVDLASLTNDALATVAAGEGSTWTTMAAKPALELSPYAVFTVEKSGLARLYAMLRAEQNGPDGKPKWDVRYFAEAPGEFKIEGNDGWMTGDRFRTAMHAALVQAIEACREDTQGKLTGTHTVTASGQFPFVNTDAITFRFIVVKESPELLVARLAAGDAIVLAGTHVLNRSEYKIADANFADPRK